MARLTNGDDMLTFWSRAQYMRREVEPDVTELQAPYLPIVPTVVLAHEEAGSKKVGVVHDERRSSRLRETTEFPPAICLAHATARRGGHELAEQTDVHLESFTYPKDAGQGED